MSSEFIGGLKAALEIVREIRAKNHAEATERRRGQYPSEAEWFRDRRREDDRIIAELKARIAAAKSP